MNLNAQHIVIDNGRKMRIGECFICRDYRELFKELLHWHDGRNHYICGHCQEVMNKRDAS